MFDSYVLIGDSVVFARIVLFEISVIVPLCCAVFIGGVVVFKCNVVCDGIVKLNSVVFGGKVVLVNSAPEN